MSVRCAASWGSPGPCFIAGAAAWSAMGSMASTRAASAAARAARWRRRREVERLVLGIAISAATWGCRRIAAYLARTWHLRLAPSTVQRLLRRVGRATRRARLTGLEQQAARTAGLVPRRTRQRPWGPPSRPTRAVEPKD